MVAEQPFDQELVERARAGDAEAFTVLVKRHRRQLWSVCYRVTNNRQDAEDALQDALIAAWHHMGSYRGDAAVGTWLHRIAANAALAVAKRRCRDTLVSEETAAAPDFGQRVVDTDAVHVALSAVPLVFRGPLVLRELCDMTYEEIAEHEGIGVQTVKSRISRGRAALRSALSKDVS